MTTFTEAHEGNDCDTEKVVLDHDWHSGDSEAAHVWVYLPNGRSE